MGRRRMRSKKLEPRALRRIKEANVIIVAAGKGLRQASKMLGAAENYVDDSRMGAAVNNASVSAGRLAQDSTNLSKVIARLYL
jgi:anti-sigma factor RsiW